MREDGGDPVQAAICLTPFVGQSVSASGTGHHHCHDPSPHHRDPDPPTPPDYAFATNSPSQISQVPTAYYYDKIREITEDEVKARRSGQ
ncbi:hypothetical protein EKO27_g12054 [Xylaria grammica]|uniref:Uncharacterized protein n=1 Tax=Xylaria grammica TaxID=363999 RepID=A0A439CLT7_9PEZI|nr:hypothetical protein EKO27_g12054 [Xylaria grammica]